jgi:hypothetical protein
MQLTNLLISGKEALSSPSPTAPALASAATSQRYVILPLSTSNRTPRTDLMFQSHRWNSPSSSPPSSAATSSNPTRPSSRPAKASCASLWASMWECVGGSGCERPIMEKERRNMIKKEEKGKETKRPHCCPCLLTLRISCWVKGYVLAL